MTTAYGSPSSHYLCSIDYCLAFSFTYSRSLVLVSLSSTCVYLSTSARAFRIPADVHQGNCHNRQSFISLHISVEYCLAFSFQTATSLVVLPPNLSTPVRFRTYRLQENLPQRAVLHLPYVHPSITVSHSHSHAYTSSPHTHHHLPHQVPPSSPPTLAPADPTATPISLSRNLPPTTYFPHAVSFPHLNIHPSIPVLVFASLVYRLSPTTRRCVEM
ncbi:hypothetical protein COCCADRAFT_112658 [Bipolaris zeicola 26-R-13]|uniref:Uncharacterized protein n=1 Tax=Cochliobolus carbonum (strain 26-R-13) TaxID=930089 RepID=W6Y6W4_COCC2|nr:uncharacterized protein COCCADRAFT_112658 [Bipolaris zeicola 26-R-13]EUC27066.1 hypothetical protein COCCADRAFT_112658 [Bipolaris zeicola 26-R-13]